MALNRRQTLSTLPSSYGNMNHSFREFGAENVPPHSKSKDRYSMAPYGSGKNGGFPPQKKDRSDSMGFYNSNRLSGKRQSINFPKESNGRQSIAQGSRRSSVHNRKISQQDPRPVGDKKYTSEMIKNLIAFLTTHQFPQEISQKMLTCPSTQQFVDISEFLLQHLDPEFKFSHWQHELPEMFQMLGYGVKIKPHALKNVGSPHAWPTLLAALTWLIELLNVRR